MSLYMLLQDILSWNMANPPFIREIFIPYADKAHRMREYSSRRLVLRRIAKEFLAILSRIYILASLSSSVLPDNYSLK
jgi:hypothetical protein